MKYVARRRSGIFMACLRRAPTARNTAAVQASETRCSLTQTEKRQNRDNDDDQTDDVNDVVHAISLLLMTNRIAGGRYSPPLGHMILHFGRGIRTPTHIAEAASNGSLNEFNGL